VSLCVVSGTQCVCQPDEGMMCPEVAQLKERIAQLERKVADLRIISNVNGDWNLKYAAALQRAEQSDLALAEARRKALEEAAKVCEASSGVNAIPETNAYANGWNDCRKEAFDARQRSAAAIRAMREPK
jgi:phage protein D